MGKVYLGSQLYMFHIVMDHTILLALLIKMLDCYGSKMCFSQLLTSCKKRRKAGAGITFHYPL